MNKKTLISIGAYVVVAYGAYYYFFSKTAYAKKILSRNKTAATLEELKSRDMGYLRAWASAAAKNLPAFVYQGKTYNTQGGAAKR